MKTTKTISTQRNWSIHLLISNRNTVDRHNKNYLTDINSMRLTNSSFQGKGI